MGGRRGKLRRLLTELRRHLLVLTRTVVLVIMPILRPMVYWRSCLLKLGVVVVEIVQTWTTRIQTRVWRKATGRKTARCIRVRMKRIAGRRRLIASCLRRIGTLRRPPIELLRFVWSWRSWSTHDVPASLKIRTSAIYWIATAEAALVAPIHSPTISTNPSLLL